MRATLRLAVAGDEPVDMVSARCCTDLSEMGDVYAEQLADSILLVHLPHRLHRRCLVLVVARRRISSSVGPIDEYMYYTRILQAGEVSGFAAEASCCR